MKLWHRAERISLVLWKFLGPPQSTPTYNIYYIYLRDTAWMIFSWSIGFLRRSAKECPRKRTLMHHLIVPQIKKLDVHTATRMQVLLGSSAPEIHNPNQSQTSFLHKFEQFETLHDSFEAKRKVLRFTTFCRVCGLSVSTTFPAGLSGIKATLPSKRANTIKCWTTLLHSMPRNIKKLNGKPRNAPICSRWGCSPAHGGAWQCLPSSFGSSAPASAAAAGTLHMGINESEETCPSAIVKWALRGFESEGLCELGSVWQGFDLVRLGPTQGERSWLSGFIFYIQAKQTRENSLIFEVSHRLRWSVNRRRGRATVLLEGAGMNATFYDLLSMYTASGKSCSASTLFRCLASEISMGWEWWWWRKRTRRSERGDEEDKDDKEDELDE